MFQLVETHSTVVDTLPIVALFVLGVPTLTVFVLAAVHYVGSGGI
jgi:hypothetical protein